MILIFGGNGFIGQHVARHLADLGEQVVVTAFSRTASPALLADAIGRGQAHVAPADLTDGQAVMELVAKWRPRIMIDLSGHHPKALDPANDVRFRTSVLLNMLESGRIHGVQRIVLMSSMDVYWGIDASASPFQEDDPVPLLEQDDHFIVQSWVKKSLEIIGNLYRRQHGMDIAFIRASGIYGPFYRTYLNAPSRIARAAATGTAMELGAPGVLPFAQDGYDQVYVKDMAQGISLVALAPALRHPVYNIGSGRVPLYAEFVEAARKAVPDFHLTLPDRPSGQAPGLMEGRWMSIRRARDELGYTPRFSVEEAMADYIAWLQSQS